MLRDLLYVGKAQRKGLLILALLILFALAIRWYILSSVEPSSILSAVEIKETHTAVAERALPEKVEIDSRSTRAEPSIIKESLSTFNPNTISASELSRYDLPKYVVNNFIKYRNAGAKFYNLNDVRRVYGMNDTYIEKLTPYLRFETRSQGLVHKEEVNNTSKGSNTSTRESAFKIPITTSVKDTSTYSRRFPSKKAILDHKVEINSCDTSDLMQIKGIGKYYASRILKFRDALGGFYNVSQIADTYGLKPEAFAHIKNNVIIDASVIRRLSINKLDYKGLTKHPYISPKEAKIVLRYRKKHGSFRDIESVLKSHAFATERLNALRPYLDFKQ